MIASCWYLPCLILIVLSGFFDGVWSLSSQRGRTPWRQTRSLSGWSKRQDNTPRNNIPVRALHLTTRGGSDDAADSEKEQRDHSGQVSSLFGNLRIPAALFAGASAGSAFAMPLTATDGLNFGITKRLYALLMVGSLSAQIIVIVVSTMAMGALSTRPQQLTRSTQDLLDSSYNFEWITTKLHFLMGILLFVTASGLRAWVSISCSVFAKAAVGLIASSTIFCLAVIDERERENNSSLLKIPFKFFRLMIGRIKRVEPLFAVSFVLGAGTFLFILAKAPHIYHYLAE